MQQGNRIILVLGILAIAAGIFVWFEASSFRKKARLTEGKVVYVLGSSFRIQYVTEEKRGSRNPGFMNSGVRSHQA